MRTSSLQPKTMPPSTSAKSTSINQTYVGQGHRSIFTLNLQRTIGNQALLRIIQSNIEESNDGLAGRTLTHIYNDSSQVPMRSHHADALQTSIKTNTMGDRYEQKASHVAEQVKRKNNLQLQRACTCGDGCATCRKESLDPKREYLKAENMQIRDSSVSVIPLIARDALRSHGQPLDLASRAFMEPRFGHDFSQVRVHTDNEAARAAHAVQARAYTIGHDIVFGEGQYRPATSEGKLLLAHELTHVVQQGGAGVAVARRQVHASSTSHALAIPGRSGATERLHAVIADIERIQASARRNASNAEGKQDDGQSESQEHVEKLANFLEQLWEVARSQDEELKLRVLAGFSSQGLKQSEAKLAEEDATTREVRPESMAAKAIGVSHPQDAAEVEAERVAEAVVHGSHARVNLITPDAIVSRQAEALAAAGATILTLEADSLPATSWNPPGWVFLGISTVLAAALIGTAVFMSRPGNEADTGILEEVQRLIQAAKAAGTALTMCEALAQLMAAAESARDTRRISRIKATQKDKGCRHSRHSKEGVR